MGYTRTTIVSSSTVERRALKAKCQWYSKMLKRKHTPYYLPFHLDHTQTNIVYVKLQGTILNTVFHTKEERGS